MLVVLLAGGFTTNCIWCVLLHWRNRSAGEYLGREKSLPDAPGQGESALPPRS